ncbi:MAG: ribonuclease HII [Candidatus Nomurabacteria bacterium]
MADTKTTKYIIGIDEVGRGPLAGPVAVCAFLIKDEKFLESAIGKAYGKVLPKLKDSKKLSKKQREVWFEFLKLQKKEGDCDYAVSFVSPENIDKFGIAKCIQKALNESLQKVASQNLSSFQIFLDGGLKAPIEYVNQETIIRGDELHPVISMASIVAKVTRDAVMTKYAKDYPEYGFECHSGYGTKAHYDAIKKHGQTPIHRKSYIH